MQMVKWTKEKKPFKQSDGSRYPQAYVGYCFTGKIGGVPRFRYIGNPPTYKGMPELLRKEGKKWKTVKEQVTGYAHAVSIAEDIASELLLNKSMGRVGKSSTQPITDDEFEMGDHPCNGAATALMTKEHEPLIIRKYTQYGFPLYIAMICGANLDNLDDVVLDFVDKNKVMLMSNSIQQKRNLCGLLTEHICKTYGRKAEGVAVLWYMDKMWVSSLFGDFMNHAPCKIELFTLLSIMPHV